MNFNEFKILMNTVAQAWNKNDAKTATECFTEDAIYMEPPDQQLYKGKKELYEFFGGEKGRESKMHMTWHSLMFNEQTQTGSGEFTFKMKSYSHGVVIVKVKNNKICLWREYFWSGDLSFKEFTDENKKFKWTITTI